MWFFHKVNDWLLVGAGLVVTFAPFAFCAGCSPRVIATEHTDSVRVEIRERVVRDTAYYEVQREVERVVVRDTISRLENTYAASEASVDSLGYLHHSLESKPQYIPVPYEVTVHDTTVVEKAADTITIETNRLTRSQERWLVFGKVAAGLLAGILLAIVGFVALKILKYI